MDRVLTDGPNWLWSGAIICGSVVLAFIAHRLFFRVVKKVGEKRSSPVAGSLSSRSQNPSLVSLTIIALIAAVGSLPVSEASLVEIRRFIALALIASLAWLTVALTGIFEDLAYTKYRVDVKDNLAARRMRTRIRVLRRVVVVIIAGLAVSIMLMTFPSLRRIGTSILASAGLAGLVAGIAARPTLSNLIAGLQVALAEPIRLDDVVVVEGEWGWIEEITTTFVVVRVWDLRRLVLPLSYFITKPFQNWTRITADLLGTVYLYADYTVPVEEVRQELLKILQSTDMWDGKAWALQVTNADRRVIEMRALMSAADSSTAWNLRCYVREKLIDFLQKNYPDALPKTRAEISKDSRESGVESRECEKDLPQQSARRPSRF